MTSTRGFLLHALQQAHSLDRIKTYCLREFDEFDNVEPTLPALDLGDKRLVPSELPGHLGLGHFRRMSCLDE